MLFRGRAFLALTWFSRWSRTTPMARRIRVARVNVWLVHVFLKCCRYLRLVMSPLLVLWGVPRAGSYTSTSRCSNWFSPRVPIISWRSSQLVIVVVPLNFVTCSQLLQISDAALQPLYWFFTLFVHCRLRVSKENFVRICRRTSTFGRTNVAVLEIRKRHR